ncbi:MAG: 5-formyltetrahydrofolate cyclo-ligase [Alteromonadaceae bacterium]|nr:5-formyltetrahydrofolate cyclo-ligase [Alteromonadaceae bacterium]
MNDQRSTRKEIRQQVRLLRQQLTLEQQQQATLKLVTQLVKHPKIIKAQHIALYLANDGELDTQAFIHWCWQQNKHVYLPVIHPFSKGQLLFLKYNQNTVMTNNKYGIKEPKLNITQLCLLSQLDVLLTPLVAFDQKGNRLGMGGGFYDRTLASWYKHKNKKQPTLYPIGLAHDCQQLASIPSESWDIPLPEIITPTKCYRF